MQRLLARRKARGAARARARGSPAQAQTDAVAHALLWSFDVSKPHVLVPYDFSAAAELALAWARDYVRAAGGTIHVVHVVPTSAPSLVSMPSGGGATAGELERISEDLSRRINERHVNATIELLLSPSPSTAICESAAEHKATLIVMGTEGRSGLSRLALGSVADYLVRNAKCPVVTMRAPKAEDDEG